MKEGNNLFSCQLEWFTHVISQFALYGGFHRRGWRDFFPKSVWYNTVHFSRMRNAQFRGSPLLLCWTTNSRPCRDIVCTFHSRLSVSFEFCRRGQRQSLPEEQQGVAQLIPTNISGQLDTMLDHNKLEQFVKFPVVRANIIPKSDPVTKVEQTVIFVPPK
ncbi:hypothetical protein M513_12109 [Trichuris suis]|uniref:Uncharacterized protein n=1 Tax=Trichuris suis TaxID=68888 RepID=A0A085LPY1_9BILA|nr:hypothetical protein M513_12109 [Trichuris suis]